MTRTDNYLPNNLHLHLGASGLLLHIIEDLIIGKHQGILLDRLLMKLLHLREHTTPRSTNQPSKSTANKGELVQRIGMEGRESRCLVTFWRARFFDDWQRMSSSTSSANAARGGDGGGGRDDKDAAGFLWSCSPHLCIPINSRFDAEQTLDCEFQFSLRRDEWNQNPDRRLDAME